MKKHEVGKGSYGFSYELEIEERNGKKEWHRYIFKFEDLRQREVAMLSARSITGIKKLRRV